jgi:hypothetical protein
MTKTRSTTTRKFVIRMLTLAISIATLNPVLPSVGAETVPQVELSPDSKGPRPVEELTSQVIVRDYARAWQTMAEAMENNRDNLLDGFFTGSAKENLSNLIAKQRQTGIHTRYVDRGHRLVELFYSPAGDVMQLRDQAQLEIQVFDGQKLIDSERVTLQYIVLMTPGADRWLVRDLESVAERER